MIANDHGGLKVQPLTEMLEVGAEVRVPVATTQLVRLNVTDPVDIVMMDRSDYWLELCLDSRPSNTKACYLDHWSAERFERIGKIYFLPPGETVRTRTDGGPAHASVLCHMRPDSMNQWFDGALKWTDRSLEASLDIADENIRNLLVRLGEEMRHPGFASNMLVELIVAQLSIELGRYFVQFDEIPAVGALSRWRLQLIDERLQDSQDTPTLTELAALCKLSVRQLTRGFRASRSCSIGEYVASSRIARAKRLLVSDASVKGIAYSLGFTSSSAFCFAFRRATGMTPGEFRASGTSRQVTARAAARTRS